MSCTLVVVACASLHPVQFFRQSSKWLEVVVFRHVLILKSQKRLMFRGMSLPLRLEEEVRNSTSRIPTTISHGYGQSVKIVRNQGSVKITMDSCEASEHQRHQGSGQTESTIVVFRKTVGATRASNGGLRASVQASHCYIHHYISKSTLSSYLETTIVTRGTDCLNIRPIPESKVRVEVHRVKHINIVVQVQVVRNFFEGGASRLRSQTSEIRSSAIPSKVTIKSPKSVKL